MNGKGAEKDALHAPTEKCVRVLVEKKEKHFLDTADVVRDAARLPRPRRLTVAVGTTIADRPPFAQIRTGAFTHTALTVDEWRRNVLLAAHRTIPGTCASRSVSDACGMERCSPQSVPFPPGLRRRHAALRCSAGSLVLRHSPTSPVRSCPPCGLWPSRTGLGRLTKTCRRSPVLVHVVSQRARVLRLRRTEQSTRDNVVALLPSSTRNGVGVLFHRLFQLSSIARPTDTSVYASSDTSRCPQQDSRSGWIRYFLSCPLGPAARESS